jgi:uncharacterized cupin superfamily protein
MAVTRLGRVRDAPQAWGVRGIANPLRPELFVGKGEAQLAKGVGLTQFGVNHLTLRPGAASALRHWHEQEDEFVYVLSGRLTLVDGVGEHEVTAGDFVGFPAGEPNAHHLINRSDAPATFLAIGARHRGEERIHYPDDPALGVASVRRDGRGDRIPD